MTRAEREAKALEAVRQWLPELQPCEIVQIEAREPTEDDESLFHVIRLSTTREFVCHRGSKGASDA